MKWKQRLEANEQDSDLLGDCSDWRYCAVGEKFNAIDPSWRDIDKHYARSYLVSTNYPDLYALGNDFDNAVRNNHRDRAMHLLKKICSYRVNHEQLKQHIQTAEASNPY